MEINMDKIKSGLDKAAVSTVKVTEKAFSHAKLKFKITELKGKMDDGYKNLGRLIYESGTCGDEVDCGELEEKINAAKLKLDEYAEELSALNDELNSRK